MTNITWFKWGEGATKFGADTRANSARILWGARKDRNSSVEIIGPHYYRVTRDDVMALIRTR